MMLFFAMGKFGRKLSSAFKVMQASSSRSHERSTMRYTKHEESLMHEDEETVPTEEEQQEQEQPTEEGNDDPHLDFEGAQEMQVYNLIKNHEFVHTPTYHPDLLKKTGMDSKSAII